MMKQSNRKICFISGIACCSILAVAQICIGAFLTPITNSVVDSQLNDQIILNSGNKGNWGEIPGANNLFIGRDISLFNFTNARDALLHHKTPQFHLTPEIHYQEYQSVSDLQDLNNGDQLAYNQTISMVQLDKSQDSILDQKVQIPNLAAIGAWLNLKTYNRSHLAYNAFAGLVSAIVRDETSLLSVTSTGTWYLFIKDQKTANTSYFDNIGDVSDSTKSRLWTDVNYGWSTLATLYEWSKAAYHGIESNVAIMLQNHFQLSRDQMNTLLMLYQENVQTTMDTIVQQYSCPNNYCDSHYITSIQWATQAVTLKPPIPTIKPFPSLAMQNETVYGYPEFSYYQKELFLPTVVNDTDYEKYKNVTITVEQATKLTNTSQNASNPATNIETLSHQYNMMKMFEWGDVYDASKNLKDLDPIVERFGLTDVYMARSQWEYCKYLGGDFATFGYNITPGGKGIISEIMHEKVYSLYHDLIHLTVKSKMVTNLMNNEKITCATQLKNSSPIIPEDSITKACKGQEESFSEDWVTNLVDYCYWQNKREFDSKIQPLGLTLPQINLVCSVETNLRNQKLTISSSFVSYEQQVNQAMSTAWGCTEPTHCSRNEILALQWTQSKITMNPPALLGMNKTDSIVDWVTNTPLSYYRFEFPAYGNLYNVTMPDFNLENSLKLINYERILSPLSIAKAIAEYGINKNSTFCNQKFFFPDAELFDNYTKYSMIEGYFEGYTLDMTIRDTVFGFTNGPMKELSTRNPMIGGDPTINPTVTVMKLNETISQVRNTGKNNQALDDVFHSINGKSFISFNNTVFNGNETYQEWDTPWQEKVELKGTDNLMGPNLNEDSTPTIYMNDFFRFFSFKYVSDQKYYNEQLSAKRYKINDDDFNTDPINHKYYQYLYNGAFNLTSVFRAPMFLTKRYFLSANQSLYDKVEMYDQNNKLCVKSDEDDLKMDVQERAGVPLSADVVVQINIDVPNDELFNSKGNTLYPILYLRRKVQFTNDNIEALFGSYMLITNNQTLIRVLLLLFGALALLMVVLLGCCMKKSMGKGDVVDDHYHEVKDDSEKNMVDEIRTDVKVQIDEKLNKKSTKKTGPGIVKTGSEFRKEPDALKNRLVVDRFSDF